MTGDLDSLLNDVLNEAVDAARAAGGLLREGFEKPKSIRHKGEINLVTEYDLAAEKIIVDQIASRFPDHGIVAEESGRKEASSPCRWYIDPLDGTTNFAHSFPVFAVSIGFEITGPQGPEMHVGVVFDPLRDELYTAVKDQGARLNGHALAVSLQTDLDRALVATGFPYDIRDNPDPVLSRFRTMALTAQGVRRAGAAALDLAWVAAGRLDGFWEERLWPWDTAAGLLLVREAGGIVTDFSGLAFLPEMKEILATNGHLHYNMMRILNPEIALREVEADWSREEHR